MHTIAFARYARGLAAAAALALAAGCSLESQGAPSLTGPSEFGLSLAMSASPDQILRDGSTQSTVTVTSLGPDGKPIGGQRIALAIGNGAEGVLPELVKLSADVVTAGSDGRATFAVVAPPADSTGDRIYVQLRPVSTDAANTAVRSFVIGVYPSNPTPPTADLQGPDTAVVGETIVFDASASSDGSVSCHLTACSFSWDFGDGTGASGMVVTKAYMASGRYVVRLTVRDSVGAVSTRTKTITVTDLEPAVITVSPDPPFENQAASFTVTVTVPPGLRIDHYEWLWGGGEVTTTTSRTATHTYGPGAHTVTVNVYGASGEIVSTGVLSFTTEAP